MYVSSFSDPTTRMALLIYCIFSFAIIGFDEVYSLWCATPIYLGQSLKLIHSFIHCIKSMCSLFRWNRFLVESDWNFTEYCWSVLFPCFSSFVSICESWLIVFLFE